VVLLIGINDLCFYGTPVRDVVDGILANVAELRARLPRTRVLLLGLLPSGARPATSLRDRISRTNRLLSRAADDEEVRFLDVGPSLLEPDGTLGPAAAPDHLHLTERGYRLWAEGDGAGHPSAGPGEALRPPTALRARSPRSCSRPDGGPR